MRLGISIRPSKELQNNYNQISALARNNPVVCSSSEK